MKVTKIKYISRKEHFCYADGAAVEMQYDALNRRTRVKDSLGTTTIKRNWTGSIIAVAKDGAPLRDYTYGPFSNRARMTDHRKGSTTAYTYDVTDRLTMAQTWETQTDSVQQGTDKNIPDIISLPQIQPILTITYQYDHRGNLTKELQEGIPLHSYAYNAMDRLAKAWSHTPDGAVQTETSYYYNGLGQRVGKGMYTAMPDRTAGERTIQNLPQTQPLHQGWTMGQPADSMAAAVREDYLPDLTRPYHNLLSVTRNDGSPAQTFYWDRRGNQTSAGKIRIISIPKKI